MKTIQNTLNSWATSQGINLSYVMMFGGMGGRGMKGFGGRHGNWRANPPITPVPSQ